MDGPGIGPVPVRLEGAFNDGTTGPILRDTIPDFARVLSLPLISGSIDARLTTLAAGLREPGSPS